MLFDHVVHHDLNRLRCAKVEVDVAKAADVEAREDAAGRGFGIKAGHLARERQQRVAACRLVIVQLLGADDRNRNRDIHRIFNAALGGDGDDAIVGGGSRRCGGLGMRHRRDCERRDAGEQRCAELRNFHKMERPTLSLIARPSPDLGGR